MFSSTKNPCNYPRLLWSFIVVVTLAGCTQTKYTNQRDEDKTSSMRAVRMDLKPAFYKKALLCVAVLPTMHSGSDFKELAIFVEQAVSRHLSQRFIRVINSNQRDEIVRRLKLNIFDASDQRRFLKAHKCDALVLPELISVIDDYYIVWSGKSIDIRLRLFTPGIEPNGNSDELLWIARHATSRNAGSLPLDLLSLGVGAFKASSHSIDAEVHLSLVEDAIRRMMATLPDTRVVASESLISRMVMPSTEPLAQQF
jgi:hypothetical protein